MPLAGCPQLLTMVLLYVLIYAILLAAEPSTCVNFPPIKAWLQSLVSWMELTTPLVLGAQDVIVYGAVWLKLKMLFLVKVWPPWLICLICSVVPVGASAGVPVAGWGDTGPLWAAATAGIRPAALAVSAHKATTGALHSNQRLTPCIMPPFAPHDRRGHQSPPAPRCDRFVFLCIPSATF